MRLNAAAAAAQIAAHVSAGAALERTIGELQADLARLSAEKVVDAASFVEQHAAEVAAVREQVSTPLLRTRVILASVPSCSQV